MCPFLNEDKLCRLVMQYGDEMLSETCQVFPREKHEFGERVEHILMPCCPAWSMHRAVHWSSGLFS